MLETEFWVYAKAEGKTANSLEEIDELGRYKIIESNNRSALYVESCGVVKIFTSLSCNLAT